MVPLLSPTAVADNAPANVYGATPGFSSVALRSDSAFSTSGAYENTVVPVVVSTILTAHDSRAFAFAVGLDPARQEVHLEDGTRLAYDDVVLAPGAVPRKLPGTDGCPGVHVLRTYDDAVRLREAVRAAGTLTVVGGGPLGCEAAASARTTGAQVDLVERLAGPMVSVLGPRLAAAVAGLHEAAGVRLHWDADVTATTGRDGSCAFELADGTVLPSAVVLLALGVTPATRWLDGSGLDLTTDGAARCDRSGRTSHPGVWAVGDAAAWPDGRGLHRRVEHWMSAVEQAATLAACLAGSPVPEAAPAYFWSDQYDTVLQSVGDVGPRTELEVHHVGAGLVALHGEGDRLDGVVTLDARRQVGRARRLLRAGAGLGEARTALIG